MALVVEYDIETLTTQLEQLQAQRQSAQGIDVRPGNIGDLIPKKSK
jgi:hypothetical protein